MQCSAEHTSFNRLMSNMNTIPVFGKSVTVYVPIIMILVALITLFNGYGRLIKYIGMETEDSLVTGAGIFCASVLSEDDVAQLEAGKRLISSATRGMGFSSENGAVHSPLRPTRTLLSSGSPLSASSFKYQMADSGGAVASVDLDEEEDELETVDFSVLFKRETSSSSSGSALLGANSKPKLPGSPSSLAQLNNDQHVDPLNEAIGAGLGKVTSFFRSVASSERVQQFGWGTRPQVSQPLPQFDDDAEITPRMSASLRRQAELESGQVKAASYTGRYK